MRKETSGNHTLIVFDSFNELIGFNESSHDYRSASMSGRGDWFGGVTNMPEALALARKGLPAEGIEALAIAESNVHQLDQDLRSQMFQTVYSVDGSDVDVARYLSGEPENMISYYLDDVERVERVVTLVIAINVPSCVSASAITKHGHALMSLVEAIERTGLQAEIWADSTVSAGYGTSAKTGRIATRLKSAGEPFDAGMFMFALTHPAMLRAILLNTMHEYPAAFRKALRVRKGGGYGSNRTENAYVSPGDYPEGAIIIPAIMGDYQAGNCLNDALVKLGLLDA